MSNYPGVRALRDDSEKPMDLWRKPVQVDPPAAHQCAAVCCRTGPRGTLQVLLITSKDTGRWVIPKGNIDEGEKPYLGALREAYEEAGVWGKVRKRALGYYSYVKDGAKRLTVSVHLLKVKTEADSFPEAKHRRKLWVHPWDAADLVSEPELKALFEQIALKNPMNSQDRWRSKKYTLSRNEPETATSARPAARVRAVLQDVDPARSIYPAPGRTN